MPPSISRIRPWLYLSNYQATLDRPLLDQLGITTLFTLAFPAHQAGLASLHYPIRDGEPIPPIILTEGLAFIRAQRTAHMPPQARHPSIAQDACQEAGQSAGQSAGQNSGQGAIVIACAAGISRSATFCIGALAEAEGLSLAEAWRDIKASRPQVWPHAVLWQSLCTHFNQPVPYDQMLDRLGYPTLANSDRPLPPSQFGDLNV